MAKPFMSDKDARDAYSKCIESFQGTTRSFYSTRGYRQHSSGQHALCANIVVLDYFITINF